MKVTQRSDPFWAAPSDDAEIEIGTKYGKPAVMVKGWIRYGSNSAANCFLLTDPNEIEALRSGPDRLGEEYLACRDCGVSGCRAAFRRLDSLSPPPSLSLTPRGGGGFSFTRNLRLDTRVPSLVSSTTDEHSRLGKGNGSWQHDGLLWLGSGAYSRSRTP